MGDCPKEYMAFNNVEDEHRDDWENGKQERVRLADGTLVGCHDDILFRPATEAEIAILKSDDRKAIDEIGGYRRSGWGDSEAFSVLELPAGAEKVQVPCKELFPTFDAYMEDQGYEKDEEQGAFGYWENPNRKWDWYQVGGRWSGLLKLKEGVEGTLGKRSLLDRSEDTRAADRRADQAKKGDVDWAGMRDEKGQKAGVQYDKVHTIIAGRPIPNWDEIRERHGKDKIQEARAEYWGNPIFQDLRASEDEDVRWMDNVEDFNCTREVFVQAARDAAGVTFAVLHEGKWYERGSMGWWGCVSDEKDTKEWYRQFAELIDGLPDDTTLTVVDCHI
ncbi:hypothetical protein FQZ97_706150 [compost metagenome]